MLSRFHIFPSFRRSAESNETETRTCRKKISFSSNFLAMNQLFELKSPRTETVQANYNKLSEHIRRLTPQGIQCSVFCGGEKCKYENPENWKPDSLAIHGIYSHWWVKSRRIVILTGTQCFNRWICMSSLAFSLLDEKCIIYDVFIDFYL